jgi:hypothetical protein
VPTDKLTGGQGSPIGPPAAVQTFLRDVVKNSLMRYDVLHFFYQNPYAILTISDLTVWMSLEERPLAEALQQLAVEGYLRQSPASAAFTLTPDRERRRQIDYVFDNLSQQPDLAREIRNDLRRRLETTKDG